MVMKYPSGKHPTNRGWGYPFVVFGLEYASKARDAGADPNCYLRELMERIDGANSARRGYYYGAQFNGYDKSKLELWSVFALHAVNRDPRVKLRVEHGSPKAAFAARTLDLYTKDKLTEEVFNQELDRLYKLAVITLDEDQKLNDAGLRSKMLSSPEERWNNVGITIINIKQLTAKK
jgi:hypothetical protein